SPRRQLSTLHAALSSTALHPRLTSPLPLLRALRVSACCPSSRGEARGRLGEPSLPYPSASSIPLFLYSSDPLVVFAHVRRLHAPAGTQVLVRPLDGRQRRP